MESARLSFKLDNIVVNPSKKPMHPYYSLQLPVIPYNYKVVFEGKWIWN
jgi:hypothetical protein